MYATIFSFLLVLLQLICVIVVACLLTMSRFSIDMPDGHHTLKMQFLLILILCTLSIYGTVSSVEMPSALVNLLDFGPMVASLIRGLVVGQGTGLIGVAFRWSAGAVIAIPCFLATIPALLSGGIIWLGFIQKFCGCFPQSDDISLMATRVK